MPALNTRYRQIHLDFHTSGKIPGIGEKFSKRQFREALKTGGVNSINIFAKCHHGFSYHPTEVGTMHPHLKFDLLGEMIEACHGIDVKCPVYISAGFDEDYGERHPGHRRVPPGGDDPLRVGWRGLCFNTPYLDYLCAQIEEVMRNYETDGIWLDIVRVSPCFCEHCLGTFYERGMDPHDESDVETLRAEIQKKYYERTTGTVRKLDPEMAVFQNGGHITKGDREYLKHVSHLELESLPTGGWGYDHFPLSAKYAATIEGYEYIGMTGKFHTHWGEFGGFKHPNALRWECASMAAHGARCCVGDQLHPSGEMNMDTYRLVGEAYAEVERNEPWITGARPVSEVAILSIEALRGLDPLSAADKLKRNANEDVGAGRMLLELQILFDVIDADADFSRYRLIILPDRGRLRNKLAKKLRDYVKSGGKLVLSYESGMKSDSDAFWFPIGKVEGRSHWDVEYLELTGKTARDGAELHFPKGPFKAPGASVQLKPAKGFTELVRIHKPYFNRTREHFCSHLNTPDDGPSGYPGVVTDGRVAWFAHPLFSHYADYGQRLHRDLVKLVLQRLLGKGAVETTMPSMGRVTLTEQEAEKRRVLHLLYASPVKRGGNVSPGRGQKDIEVIEDIVPLSDVVCRVRGAGGVKSVTLEPEGKALPFEKTKDEIVFTVPRVDGHQMVCLG